MNDKLIKQFVNYNIALELKSIGFDEPCLAYYNKKELFSSKSIILIIFLHNSSRSL